MDDTLYFFVNKHISTVDSYWCIVGFLNSLRRHNGVDTSITLDVAKWNCDGAELSSCVITLFYWIMYYNIRNTYGKIFQLTFILLLYIYMFMFLLYCDLHAYFHSARIFKVCNSVI